MAFIVEVGGIAVVLLLLTTDCHSSSGSPGGAASDGGRISHGDEVSAFCLHVGGLVAARENWDALDPTWRDSFVPECVQAEQMGRQESPDTWRRCMDCGLRAKAFTELAM